MCLPRTNGLSRTQQFVVDGVRNFCGSPGYGRFGIDLTVRIPDRVFVVKEDRCEKVVEDTIVHIGTGHGNVTQTGHAELAGDGGVVNRWVSPKSGVGICRRQTVLCSDCVVLWDTDVVIAVVGKRLFGGEFLGV